MNRDSALAFLKRHQPLPDDEELGQELISEYDSVRKFFLEHPDPECIPLFLNSFGKGGGLSVYQLIEDVLAKFSKEQILPSLATSLRSPHHGVRYWCVQIAAIYPSAELVDPLQEMLAHRESDLRTAAATALEQIDSNEVTAILSNAMQNETDEEVRKLLTDILRERG